MISTYYMREIQKENERYIERANEIKRYYNQDGESKPSQPGIVARFLTGTGSLLISIGTRLQGFSV